MTKLGRAILASVITALIASAAVVSPTASAQGSTPSSACRLSAGTDEGTIDFNTYLRPIGPVKGIVLFVDFPDVQSSEPTSTYFDLIAPSQEWFATSSFGRLSLQLTPVHGWLRMPGTSGSYSFGDGATFAEHRTYLNDAVRVADASVDFSPYQLLYVVSPREATSLPNSPAFIASTSAGIQADGTVLRWGANQGADLWAQGWGHHVLVHETGHTFGLPDLYEYGAGFPELHRFVGGWDVMGHIGGPARDLFAWHKWNLGWLDDSQIDCLVEAGTTEHTLTPVETAGGTKAVVVKLDDTRVFVAENRARLAIDEPTCETGVLVYEVDASIGSGHGPIRVHPAQPDPPGSEDCLTLNNAPFDVGPDENALFVDEPTGIRIEVMSNSGDVALVRVSRASGLEPTTHDRTISLRLRRHLVARGSIAAPEVCVSDQPVQVERRTRRGWRTVATITTNSVGGFRARIGDRPGAYRASAAATEPTATDICPGAESVIRRHRH